MTITGHCLIADRVTRGARNPNLQLAITDASLERSQDSISFPYSALHCPAERATVRLDKSNAESGKEIGQHSFGLPLRMNGMHRT